MKLNSKSMKEIADTYLNGLNGRRLSVSEIAEVYGTSASTVSLVAKRAGLTRKRYACVVDTSLNGCARMSQRRRVVRVMRVNRDTL